MQLESLAPGLSAGPDFGSLLRSLRRRWMAAATLGIILAGIAGLAAWFLMSPKYTAAAQVRVNSAQPEIMEHGYNAKDAGFHTFIRSQAALLRSRPVIHAALKRDDVKKLNLGAQQTDVPAFLEEELKVEMTDNNEFLTLTFSYSDPTVATTIVKAISESYMDQTGYGEKSGRADKIAELEKAYNTMAEGLKNKKNNYKRLSDTLGTADPLAVKRMEDEVQFNLRDLRQQKSINDQALFKAKNDQATLLARTNALVNEKVPDAAVEQALETDKIAKPLLIRMGQLRALVREYELLGLTGEPTPRVANSQIKQLEPQVEERRVKLREEMNGRYQKRLAEETKGAVEQGMTTKKFLDEQKTELDKQIKETSEKAVKLVAAPQRAGQPDQRDRTRREVARRPGQQGGDGADRAGAPPRIILHGEAELQKKDIKKQLMASIGAPMGVLFLVCMGVAWSDYRQRRVHSAQEVANGLGIRVVGAVPSVPNFEQQVIGASGQPDLEGQPVLESVDAIRTLLLRDSPARTDTHDPRHQRVVGRRQDDGGEPSGEQPGPRRPQGAADRR